MQKMMQVHAEITSRRGATAPLRRGRVGRVVGVENRLEPHRTQSTRRLHQAVLECLAANESTYKFKPSVALKRHQSLNELDVQDDDVAIADDAPHAGRPPRRPRGERRAPSSAVN